jgi:hypothetical protein
MQERNSTVMDPVLEGALTEFGRSDGVVGRSPTTLTY